MEKLEGGGGVPGAGTEAWVVLGIVGGEGRRAAYHLRSGIG
jgi:hypothetical protein